MSDETLLTGQEWAQQYDVIIRDPDGWRSDPLGYCSLSDRINEREFWERVAGSTVTASEKALKRLSEVLTQEEVRNVEEVREGHGGPRVGVAAAGHGQLLQLDEGAEESGEVSETEA